MSGGIFSDIEKKAGEGQKMFAVLIDPDKYDDNSLLDLVRYTQKKSVHFFFIGGSLMTGDRFEKTVQLVKATSDIPVVIFPGSSMQVSSRADAILFLSLISGRNPEYLIGQQVIAAPHVRKSGIEVLPTAYMLIESDNNTTANYVSNTLPIPRDKPDIAACTAMAGEMLGMKLIYMDGGSGAGGTISYDMVRGVKNTVNCPLIVGGGVTNADQANELWAAGADILVIGNAIEKDLRLVDEVSNRLSSFV